MAQRKVSFQADDGRRTAQRETDRQASKPKVKFTRKRSIVDEYPPISFGDRADPWDSVAQNILSMKETRVFQEQLLVDHRLYRGTDMRLRQNDLLPSKKKKPPKVSSLQVRDSLEQRRFDAMVNNLRELEGRINTSKHQNQSSEGVYLSKAYIKPEEAPDRQVNDSEQNSKQGQDEVLMAAQNPWEIVQGPPKIPTCKAKVRRNSSLVYNAMSPLETNLNGMKSNKLENIRVHRRISRRRSYER